MYTKNTQVLWQPSSNNPFNSLTCVNIDKYISNTFTDKPKQNTLYEARENTSVLKTDVFNYNRKTGNNI